MVMFKHAPVKPPRHQAPVRVLKKNTRGIVLHGWHTENTRHVFHMNRIYMTFFPFYVLEVQTICLAPSIKIHSLLLSFLFFVCAHLNFQLYRAVTRCYQIIEIIRITLSVFFVWGWIWKQWCLKLYKIHQSFAKFLCVTNVVWIFL